MSFLDKLFGSKKVKATSSEEAFEQAVIAHFNYGLESIDALYELRDRLEQIINSQQLGEYDGHEIATDLSDGYLYMYGSNAEALFKGVKETLEETEFMKGASIKLRFGQPNEGVKEIDFNI